MERGFDGMETNGHQKRYFFVYILKTIAILLVMNSHFDTLYPVSALGTGGALGNSLFFIVSGFSLWPINRKFSEWIIRRVERLYLPTLLATILTLFTIKRGFLTRSNALFIFVWPTMYWFVGGILVFYLLFYALKWVVSKRQFAWLFLCLLGIYALGYVLLDTSVWVVESGWILDETGMHQVLNGGFKLIYSFAMVMAGKYLRLYMDDFKQKPSFYLFNSVMGGYSLHREIPYGSIPAPYAPSILQSVLRYLVCSWNGAMGDRYGTSGRLSTSRDVS